VYVFGAFALIRTSDTNKFVLVDTGELSVLDDAIVALYAAVGRIDATVPVAV
jgi:glyoxylase-like metal-dependent hydrolase (beta-lactamase superfamily II)